ncbi:MAG: hypothetical protein WKF43_07505, partial [Acidimicrobiales bacterium]
MASGTRPTRRVYVAVALVAACGLALQVLLTRLFAATMYYHFSYLAISVGLLGTGAGGLVVYVRPGWFERGGLEAVLARWSAALAVSLGLVPLLFVRLDLRSTTFNARFAVMLALACLITALPSLAAGITISIAIKGYAQWIGRVYAADLFGAALGAVVVVPVLWLTDAPRLIAGLGLLAALASALFAWRGPQRVAAAATGCLVLLLVVSTASSVLYLPPRLGSTEKPDADRWNPLSRVIGYDSGGEGYGLVFYDRVYAPVVSYRRGDPLPDWQDLSLGPQSIGYELTGPGRALIIGGGGGRDIFNALSSDQRRVDVIELNEGIRQVIDERLDSSGSPYSLPGVDTAIGDGRTILAGRDVRYDQIHISFTDTLSANSAAGFALTENNLYTLEAFEEYLDHLAPGGVLNVSRLRRLLGDEALRVTVLTLEALRRHGIERPEDHVVVVRGRDILGGTYGTVLARLEPFSDAELERIANLADKRGEGVVFGPNGPNRDEWSGLADAASPTAFCKSYRMNVCPPSDDKPFFFNMRRLSDWGVSPIRRADADPVLVLLATLVILLVLSLLAYAAPLVLVRADRPRTSSLSYFTFIGLGFIIFEVVLIQRFVLFLGFPTYALSVVHFALLLCTGVGSALSARTTDAR